MKNRINQTLKLWLALLVAIIVFTVFSAGSPATAGDVQIRQDEGVRLGVITYSYRTMPDQSLEAILEYVVKSGLNSVELMGDVVERYAGIPKTEDPEVIRRWRTSVSMDKFREIRKMFNEKGVKIEISILGDYRWSDEEIDYAFNVCRILGAKGMWMEISEEAAKRMVPFTEKHNLSVIFHNHGQVGKPGFSFDRVLAYGPKLMLNFDAGHYYGATGQNPTLIIERLHDRIASIHIKDKTGPDASEPNKNQPFGEGETPIADILRLIKKNRWPIGCNIELEYPIPEGSDAVKEVIKCAGYCRQFLLETE